MNIKALAYLAAIGILLIAVSMMLNGHEHADHTHGGGSNQAGDVFQILDDDTHLMQAVLRVSNGQLASAPVRLTVQANQPAFIEVWVDAEDEIHVHGINAVLPLNPGVPNRIQLQTSRTGAFELELHNSPVVLGVLEVYP